LTRVTLIMVGILIAEV